MAQPVQPVDFSITAPTNGAEKIVGWYFDLAAIHQMVSALAYKSDPRTAVLFEQLCAAVGNEGYCSVTLLIAGVIFNDFPQPNLSAATYWSAYVVPNIVDIPESDSRYIPDKRFRKQPRWGLRLAIAGEYRDYPRWIARLGQASSADIALARAMLDYRTALSRTHFHAMKETAEDTTAAVCERATRQAVAWMQQALEERNVFCIGKIWHMIEDSFSLAHSLRETDASEGFPYGKVLEIYYFGNQSDHSHSRDEGLAAVSKPGSPGYRRVEAAARPLMTTLLYFTQAMNEILGLKGASAVELAIETWVEKYARVASKIFAFDQPSPQAAAPAIGSRVGTFKPHNGAWMEVTLGKIHDGDTLRCTPVHGNHAEMVIRFQSIDAPELKQTGGEQSRDALIEMMKVGSDRVVMLLTHGTGKYFRTMGTFFLCDRSSWAGDWGDVPLDVARQGLEVNLEMVRHGWAWYYQYGSEPVNETYTKAQEDAEENRRGIWAADEPPENPSDFRADKRAADKMKRNSRRRK